MTLLRVGKKFATPYSVASALSVFFAISLPLFFSCKKDGAPAPAPIVTNEQQHAKDLAGLPQAGSLDGLLGAEQGARLKDADTVTLEALTQVLKAQGVTFGEPRQLMARNQLALYCAREDSANGLDVTICEYPTADQAARGETESDVMLNKVDGHTSRRSKKSVLHLVRRSDTPEADVQKVYAAFDALAAGDAGAPR